MTVRSGPPSVTVVLPTYNAHACVARAVDSVLAQTMATIELVIVDDASSDATPALIADRYAHDVRVVLRRLAQNRGPAHARNVGIAVARGEWIAIIDADDAWRPDRLERLLAVAGGADVVFDNLMACDPATGAEIGALFPQLGAGPLTIPDLLAPQAPGTRYDFGYLKPIMRRAFLAAKGIAYDERLRTSEDLVLYLTLLLEGARTCMLDEALYLYTLPVSATTGGASAHSNTVPREDDVRAALAGVRTRYAGRMDRAAAEAIERRMEFLRRIRPLADFEFALRRGDYRRMAALLAGEASVRRDIVRRLRRKLLGADPQLRSSGEG